MTDSIDDLVHEARATHDKLDAEIVYLAKYPNVNTPEPLQRLSWVAQRFARMYRDLASKALVAADKAAGDA